MTQMELCNGWGMMGYYDQHLNYIQITYGNFAEGVTETIRTLYSHN